VECDTEFSIVFCVVLDEIIVLYVYKSEMPIFIRSEAKYFAKIYACVI